METTLRAYNRSGDRVGVLPWSSLSRTIVRNAAGALTAQVPKSELDPALLGDEVYLRVAENGVEAPDWYLLDDDGDNDADAGGTARPVSIGATGVRAILDWGTVYSWEYEPGPADKRFVLAVQRAHDADAKLARLRSRLQTLRNLGDATPAQIAEAEELVVRAQAEYDYAKQELADARDGQETAGAYLLGLDPTHGFLDVTPGHVLKTFIDRAQERGCFPHLTYSFDADVDSAGQPWPHVYSRTYDVGTTVGKILDTMAEDAWVDWEMVGFRLDVYIPDTELAEDLPDSILRLGESVTTAPRKRTRKAARSVMMANGAEGAAVEVMDPDAIARLGRREGYEGRSGITDFGTLTAATQVSLQRASNASESITVEITAGLAPPMPRPGGYVRYDQRRLSPTKLEPMRVQSIAWDYREPTKLSVELADLWLDRDVRLERRVDAILNGSSANERVPLPPLGDETAPSIPTGLVLVSAPYEDPTNGQQFAQVTASWAEVTTDVDGTPVDELEGYRIQWRQTEISSAVHEVLAGAGATSASWSPVVPGTEVEARIQSYDRWDNTAGWSDWTWVMAGVDETPPPRPSAPEVDNYLGLLRTRWDGKFVGGSARPADLAAIEVHVSDLDGFDPNEDPEATRVGTMYASGSVFRDTPYGAEQFVCLVAVDSSGNRSEPSEQVSGMTGAIVSADLLDEIIDDSRLLADVALIRTAHIDELNLNSARVSTISVAKLTAGIMNADVTVSGRLATALTGQRVELNSLGIFRWNAAGELTVAIDNNGALLTGTYRTALTGRRMEIGAAGTEARVDFYAPSGAWAFLRSRAEGNAETVELSRVLAGDTNAHRIALRSDGISIYNAPVLHSFTIGAYGAGGWMDLLDGHADSSVRIRLLNQQGYGALLRGGLGTSPNTPNFRTIRLDIMNHAETGYTGCYALNFTVNSDVASKSEIADADRGSLLASLRQTKVKEYRRTMHFAEVQKKSVRGRGMPRTVEMPGEVEIGLIAQEAPPQIVSAPGADGALGIDLYQMSAMNWGATSELADVVDALAAQVQALTEQLAELTKKGSKK